MDIILRNGKVFINKEFVKTDIRIRDHKIIKIGETNYEFATIFDISQKLVVPGFIDVHVHLREPGYEYKETIKSGSTAASRGGYTTICAMANVNPVPDRYEKLAIQLNIIRQDAVINVLPYGAITENLMGMKLATYEELLPFVCAFSDDGKGVQNKEIMKKAMKKIAALNGILVAHCEDEQYVLSDNARSEYGQVNRDIELAAKTGVQYHICHVSTKESIQAIREAKRKGIRVSCEVTPHHLVLDETVVKGNVNFKMNPPLRKKEDVEACIEGIKDGTIDMIATDHAPHSEIDKSGGFPKAANGIIGLETSFPILYTHLVQKNTLSLEKLIELMSKNPAKVFRLNKGMIQENAIADLAVIDLEQEYCIDKNALASLSKNTPFDGMKVKGKVVMTIVDGKIVYTGGSRNEM